MTAHDDHQEILIVTGMSGAGRSTVGNALEDLGWYVVDNLPPQMLRPLAELAQHAGNALPKIAAVVDVRGGKLFSDVQEALVTLRETDNVRVLFLDQFRLLLLADRPELARAAGLEDTAGRRIAGRGNFAFQPDARGSLAFEPGHRRQQRLRVGMVRTGEDAFGGPDLHDAAEIEHGDLVGEIAHHGEVVRDEDVADLVACL